MQDLYKVLAYVTRVRNGEVELLVFDHRDVPEAGLQVPAGTVEEGEALADAVVRELEEESGLSGMPPRGPIDAYVWINPTTGNRHHRSVFQFDALPGLPEAWSLQPRGGAEEEANVFVFRWLPVKDAAILAGDQGRSIGHL